eukprot:gnl/Chilomastix_cuspidata/2770.p1 GENE.gnl/Chilomastix_cuspidata/2770~~gnl/Chilomastix_cuspidata/2770.p1  ORF type:complete len:998 (-),score=418.11 gnl/Chilomastix_cuspidata/2770:53-3046(-)
MSGATRDRPTPSRIRQVIRFASLSESEPFYKKEKDFLVGGDNRIPSGFFSVVGSKSSPEPLKYHFQDFSELIMQGHSCSITTTETEGGRSLHALFGSNDADDDGQEGLVFSIVEDVFTRAAEHGDGDDTFITVSAAAVEHGVVRDLLDITVVEAEVVVQGERLSEGPPDEGSESDSNPFSDASSTESSGAPESREDAFCILHDAEEPRAPVLRSLPSFGYRTRRPVRSLPEFRELVFFALSSFKLTLSFPRECTQHFILSVDVVRRTPDGVSTLGELTVLNMAPASEASYAAACTALAPTIRTAGPGDGNELLSEVLTDKALSLEPETLSFIAGKRARDLAFPDAAVLFAYMMCMSERSTSQAEDLRERRRMLDDLTQTSVLGGIAAKALSCPVVPAFVACLRGSCSPSEVSFIKRSSSIGSIAVAPRPRILPPASLAARLLSSVEPPELNGRVHESSMEAMREMASYDVGSDLLFDPSISEASRTALLYATAEISRVSLMASDAVARNLPQIEEVRRRALTSVFHKERSRLIEAEAAAKTAATQQELNRILKLLGELLPERARSNSIITEFSLEASEPSEPDALSSFRDVKEGPEKLISVADKISQSLRSAARKSEELESEFIARGQFLEYLAAASLNALPRSSQLSSKVQRNTSDEDTSAAHTISWLRNRLSKLLVSLKQAERDAATRQHSTRAKELSLLTLNNLLRRAFLDSSIDVARARSDEHMAQERVSCLEAQVHAMSEEVRELRQKRWHQESVMDSRLSTNERVPKHLVEENASIREELMTTLGFVQKTHAESASALSELFAIRDAKTQAMCSSRLRLNARIQELKAQLNSTNAVHSLVEARVRGELSVQGMLLSTVRNSLSHEKTIQDILMSDTNTLRRGSTAVRARTRDLAVQAAQLSSQIEEKQINTETEVRVSSTEAQTDQRIQLETERRRLKALDADEKELLAKFEKARTRELELLQKIRETALESSRRTPIASPSALPRSPSEQ